MELYQPHYEITLKSIYNLPYACTIVSNVGVCTMSFVENGIFRPTLTIADTVYPGKEEYTLEINTFKITVVSSSMRDALEFFLSHLYKTNIVISKMKFH